MCGEKNLKNDEIGSSIGSPPRVRGKEKFVYGSTVIHGITPACAGKSELVLLRQGLFEDHPRVCGEKPNFICRWRANSGSPPRVRGKGLTQVDKVAEKRITPACAGKRRLPIAVFSDCKDHPRVCGEKYQVMLIFGIY